MAGPQHVNERFYYVLEGQFVEADFEVVVAACPSLDRRLCYWLLDYASTGDVRWKVDIVEPRGDAKLPFLFHMGLHFDPSCSLLILAVSISTKEVPQGSSYPC